MKFTTPIAAAVLAATVMIGAGAGSALAQGEDTPPAADPARAEFVCANLEQIQQLQADRAALIESRLALLQEARSAAEAAGNTDAVARIDGRIARTTERQGKVAERQQKLTDFAAANC